MIVNVLKNIQLELWVNNPFVSTNRGQMLLKAFTSIERDIYKIIIIL